MATVCCFERVVAILIICRTVVCFIMKCEFDNTDMERIPFFK
jgi:hypothetical protein